MQGFTGGCTPASAALNSCPSVHQPQRFVLHPSSHCRAVLSLDDDIMMPCSDLEHAFAVWRTDPAMMVGFFPRYIHGEPLQFYKEL